MDPLSVAGSIVGILAAASKVIEIVRPFVATSRDARELAIKVFNRVEHIQNVLSTLKILLQAVGSSSASSASRAAFIQIEALVCVFTDGVRLFSELESLVSPMKLPDGTELQSRHRLLWANKRGEIESNLARLQEFQVSLSTMLSIFQCHSDVAALQFQHTLESQVQNLLDSNNILAAKIKELEDTFKATSTLQRRPQSSRFSYFGDAGADGKAHRNSVMTDRASITTNSVPATMKNRMSIMSTSSIMTSFSALRFKTELQNSRVYKRVKRPESIISFSSSAIGSKAWSVFSGLSLADISVISAIALPLYPSEIKNAEHYTFGFAHTKEFSADELYNLSLYYECRKLEYRLTHIFGSYRLAIDRISMHDLEDDTPRLWKVLQQGQIYKDIYFKMNTSRNVRYALPAYTAFYSTKNFVHSCNKFWGLAQDYSLEESDLVDGNIFGFQKVIRMLDALLDKQATIFQEDIEYKPIEQNQMTLDDQMIPGPNARTEMLREFLTKERTYLVHLKDLKVVKDRVIRRRAFATDHIQSVYGNLDEILDAQMRFLFVLESHKFNGKDEQHWGRVFNQFLTKNYQYVIFAAYQGQNMHLVQQLFVGMRNIVIQDFPNSVHMFGTVTTFNQFLKEPITRFREYANFLTQFGATSDWTEDQWNELQQAINTMSRLNERIMRKELLGGGLQELREIGFDWKIENVAEFGRLLLYDEMHINIRHNRYYQNGYGAVDRDLRAYLFENCLLICSGSLTRSNELEYIILRQFGFREYSSHQANLRIILLCKDDGGEACWVTMEYRYLKNGRKILDDWVEALSSSPCFQNLDPMSMSYGHDKGQIPPPPDFPNLNLGFTPQLT